MNRVMAKFTIMIETRKKVKLYLQNTINQGKKTINQELNIQQNFFSKMMMK